MNHTRILKFSFSLLLSFAAVSSQQIIAQTEAPAHPVVGECSREFLIAYFPPNLVEDALKKANVPQDKWAAITKALSASEKDIITQVEDKASKITPNPLKDPQQRQVAVKIFKETLLNIFTAVLKKNGISDDKQISDMLDGIQQEKAKRFTECLDKHKVPSLKELQQQSGETKSPLAEASLPLNPPAHPTKPAPQSSYTNDHPADKQLDKNSTHHDDEDDSNDSDDDDNEDDEDDNDDDDDQDDDDKNRS